MRSMRWLAGVLAASAVLAQGVGGGAEGIGGLALAMSAGMQAKAAAGPSDDGRPSLGVSFIKTGDERRLLAFEGKPAGGLEGIRTLLLRYRLDLAEGAAPRLAVVLYDQDGGVWFKIGQEAASGPFTDGQVPLGSLREAAFSQDPSGKLEPEHVVRVWVGLVLDGKAKGTLALSRAQLSREAYKPAKPLPITFKDAKEWGFGKDPAVELESTTPMEGPDGQLCLKMEFTFPGGRHMYLVPTLAIPAGELEGYSALQFKLKATPPDGLSRLLISVMERAGGQYIVEPAAPAEWTTVTLPFSDFKLGGWSKDPNNKLDIGDLDRVSIGCHGGAKTTSKGSILVADIELVP